MSKNKPETVQPADPKISTETAAAPFDKAAWDKRMAAADAARAKEQANEMEEYHRLASSLTRSAKAHNYHDCEKNNPDFASTNDRAAWLAVEADRLRRALDNFAEVVATAVWDGMPGEHEPTIYAEMLAQATLARRPIRRAANDAAHVYHLAGK